MNKSLLEVLKERNQDEKKLIIDKNDLLAVLRKRTAKLESEAERETLLRHLEGGTK
ncbi:hypothetical protein M1M86_02310 [Dehalococcoidales bacterium]|nr:hypothetical protein [Dehalococcoidales bacterium]